MQIKVTLFPHKEFLMPFNYNYQVQSSIYHVLGDNPAYSKFIHDKGYDYFRMFTFGGVKGDYTVSNGKMKVTGRISFEVRSPSEEFCDIYERALLMRDTLCLFDQELEIRQVELSDIHIQQDKLNIVTASPIIARINNEDGSTLYCSPEQEKFTEIICGNISSKYRAFTGKESKLEFLYKGDAKKIVTRYKSIWITAYHLKAELSGAPELLDFAYQTGLGSRSAQGFGMFDVV